MSRILLVEDNPTNLQLMEYLLNASGHKTTSADDGESGVDVAALERPDVILMDLQMPRVSGYDAVRRVRQIPALDGVPVVAVTAFAMVGDRERILSHGFDGYIAKPIEPETFVAQVECFTTGRAVRTNVFVPAKAPAAPERCPRVLVVDNSAVNAMLTSSTLEPFGYEVIATTDVRSALDRARQDPPDLILCDVHMPVENGYEALRLVKEEKTLRSIPFVFISSSVWGESERDFAVRHGADALILRPIVPELFLEEIARHVPAGKRR